MLNVCVRVCARVRACVRACVSERDGEEGLYTLSNVLSELH